MNYRDKKYNEDRLAHEPTYKWDTFNTRHTYVDDVSQPFIEENMNVDTLIDFGGYDGLNTPNIGKHRHVTIFVMWSQKFNYRYPFQM